jgi:hypothetical protein
MMVRDGFNHQYLVLAIASHHWNRSFFTAQNENEISNQVSAACGFGYSKNNFDARVSQHLFLHALPPY